MQFTTRIMIGCTAIILLLSNQKMLLNKEGIEPHLERFPLFKEGVGSANLHSNMFSSIFQNKALKGFLVRFGRI